MKQRAFYLDNICCVLILHMIYTHHAAEATVGLRSMAFSLIGTALSFFMPWFFFKAGMMHRRRDSWEYIATSAKRLLLPFLIFLLLGVVLDAVVQHASSAGWNLTPFLGEETCTILNTTTPASTAAIWFLLSLFVVRIVFNELCRTRHPWLWCVPFALMAYGIYLAGENDWGTEFRLPCGSTPILFPTSYMGNICHGIALYALGYALKDKQFNAWIFALAAILFLAKFAFPAQLDFHTNSLTGNGYLLALLYEVAGCIAANNVFKRFLNMRLPLVTHIGENSMVYYLVHFPVLYLTRHLFWAPFADKPAWMAFLGMCLIITVSLVAADFVFRIKKLRFLIGG